MKILLRNHTKTEKGGVRKPERGGNGKGGGLGGPKKWGGGGVKETNEENITCFVNQWWKKFKYKIK